MPSKSPPTPLTHFLCLPLATPASTPHLSTSLARFAKDKAILHKHPSAAKRESSGSPPEGPNSTPSSEDENSSSKQAEAFLPPKAIRPVGTLHLTLGVMSLREQERVDGVVEFLRAVDLRRMLWEAGTVPTASNEAASMAEKVRYGGGEEGAATDTSQTASKLDSAYSEKNDSARKAPALVEDVPNPEPLLVTLRGLHPMSIPQATSSLYAHPHDPTNRLYPFCQRLRDEFLKAGFVLDEKRDLKLHATIVNTVYATERKGKAKGRGKGGGKTRGGKGRERPLKFDARELMERWREEVWAEVRIERVAVCEMGAKEDEEGMVRYVEVGGMEMPC